MRDLTSPPPVRNLAGMRGRAIIVGGQPSFERPDSQLASASQIYEDAFAPWSAMFCKEPELDRKTWEYAYILQAITTYSEGRRGLCFGSGREILPAVLAGRGAEIVATDFVPDHEELGWEARGVEDLYHPELIERTAFDERVSFRHVDMNAIDEDLTGFDFLWSTGSLEHIGSHQKGLDFVERAMDCLNPGGIAVHTTEFTLSSETRGRDYAELSFYCRRDIEGLAERLIASGHLIVLNFTRGQTAADNHVDTFPFTSGQSLVAHFKAHVVTSIGLIIQKDGLRL